MRIRIRRYAKKRHLWQAHDFDWIIGVARAASTAAYVGFPNPVFSINRVSTSLSRL